MFSTSSKHRTHLIMRTLAACFFISFLTGLLSVAPIRTLAQGNLLITPRRVVFEGNKRSEELNLANTGKDTAKYNVSFIEYRMKEDGTFEEITQPDPGQNFADKYLRFFPRMVVLAPNEAQVVKVQLTRTSELQPGEYRSHIYFRAVPNEKPLGEEETKKDSSSISVRLVPIFGITIPAIIRVGESDTKLTMSDLAFEQVNDTTLRLKLVLNRTGNMSVYGDLLVEYISPGGKTTLAGSVKGIAVYTPNAIRRFQMDLDRTAGNDYKKGKLQVSFVTQSDVKPVKLADAELLLP
jgi:P pilus assembly chaperone PapD